MSAQQDSAEAAARSARDHPALKWPARAGMFAYGVVYVIVAWLGGQLALGHRAGSASGSGALREIARQPLGAVSLWLAAAGFAALTVWQACQAVGGHRSSEGAKRWAGRLGSAVRTVVFGVLAVLAVRTATGTSGGGSGTGGVTADLMGRPFGPALVMGVGGVVAVLGIVSIHTAVTDRWRKGLDGGGRRGTAAGAVTVLARAGYLSRGGAFLLIAGLFVWAGVTHDPGKSGGLDQAIVRLRDGWLGPWLMLAISAGLACYGAFHMVRAFYLRGS